nr:serine/threonine-protein kinase [Kofleriaceae bacterium]
MSDGGEDGSDGSATKREGPSSRTRLDRGLAERIAEVAAELRLPRGTAVGRYVVLDTLGAGGMGVVYTAFDPELDRKVAVKLLQATPGGSTSGGQTWLLREAQAMARLAHPNVVAVYDVGAMPGDRVFIAMELVDGISLRAWLKQRAPRRAWREVVAVMRAAGAGLAAAHAAGLVHRDFKPDNVLVGGDGRARVMDFGLARLRGTDPGESAARDSQVELRSPLSEPLTEAGAVMGTPGYMAPEIYRNEPADARTDQFAFGVALYEALYGTRPFERGAIVDGRAVAPRPPPSSKVPAWVGRVVARAIALDPAQRFASMDDLLAELARDPTAARQRVAIGAAIAVAVAAGAIAVVGAIGGSGPAAEPPSALCTGASAQLAGAWDPGARAALEAAFRRLDKPFAADAIGGVEAALDAYAARWVAMQTDACRATRVFGFQSEDVLTARATCLDSRRVELATLAKLFAGADEALVRTAVTAARKLSPLDDCDDLAALLAPDPLPKDPAARATVVELQRQLAQARALKTASHPQDSLAIATAIAAPAAASGHLPTVAEQHLLAGEMTWVVHDSAHGEPELFAAAWAADAGKADEIKVEAWLALTNLATEQSRFDVALERWHQAAAALARLGANWELDVRVRASHALLDSRMNHYDAAIAEAREARDVADHHPDTPAYSYALLVEASILNASAHPQQALDDFAKVLAYEDALGHRRVEVAVTLATMATAEAQLGKVADAVTHLTAALAIDEAIYGPEAAETAGTLGTLAAAQAMTGDLAGSLATDERALALTAKTSGTDSEAYAILLGQVADTLVSLGRATEALADLARANAILTAKLGPAHVQTLTVALTTCDAQRAAGNAKGAIDTCSRALATAETAFGKTSPLLFLFASHTAMALADAKQPARAWPLFDRAIAIGATDPAGLAQVELLDAKAQWEVGHRARAAELAQRARDGYAQLGDAAKAELREADDWLAHHAAR